MILSPSESSGKLVFSGTLASKSSEPCISCPCHLKGPLIDLFLLTETLQASLCSCNKVTSRRAERCIPLSDKTYLAVSNRATDFLVMILSPILDGVPFSWWVGRSGERHPSWTGAPTGAQQCGCGLDQSCLDVGHFCSCGSDKDGWTNDTGLLSFRDHLPVTQIVITGTNRSNSEAAWRIGPLRCYGDREY
ncbi:Contactin-Associated Protein-Like 5 [Manis pentadactyla]|nr:Contactin-Associated Protein-Like 5 [Manis pentadactyla]